MPDAPRRRPGVADAAPRMGEDVPVSDTTREGQPPASRDGIPLQGTAVVGAGLLVSQLIATAQMLVVSRLLGPVQFGVFGALAVVLLLGSTVMAATQVVVARHVASGRSAEHISTRAILVAGLAACVVGLLAVPVLTHALHLSGAAGAVLVALAFVPLTVTGGQLGLLQGAEEHHRLGSLYVVSTGLRVAGAITGAAVGGTATATLLGLALGATAGALAGRLMLVREPPSGPREETPRALLVEITHAAHALVALYALTNLDVLIARAQLSPHDAGLYAAGALVARAVFFLPQAVLVAAFPRMVAGSREVQRQAVLVVAALGLLATLVVASVPDLVVRVVSGTQYAAVAAQVWVFALAGAGFGVVQVLLYARMAHHDRRAAVLLWSGVAALATLGLSVGTSIAALATCAAVVAWTVAAAGMVWARTSPPGRFPVDSD